MPAPTIPRSAPIPAPQRTATNVSFQQIASRGGARVVLYGPGGIGKTTLAVMAPGPIAFVDLDDSLPRLRVQFEEALDTLDVRVVAAAHEWQSLRDALNAGGWDEIRTLVIDTATRAEELAAQWVLKNIPNDKGQTVKRIEDYGYGKGYQHIYETMLELFGDLERHARAGRNVVLVCHDCTSNVPNPQGDDWIRYEPRLQTSGSGKASVRLRIREWADHVLFYGYDIDVKKGKGTGSGTRTIYPVELPHCMAKSRAGLVDSFPVGVFDGAVWSALIGGKKS